MARTRSELALALAAFVALGPSLALAKLRVVTTTTTLADLARRIGGDRVEVEALAPAAADPHKVVLRPSLAVVLSRADVLIAIGRDLEASWLPLVLLDARNERIQPGRQQLLVAASMTALPGPPPTSQPTMAAHTQGDPHVWLTPDGAAAIAHRIAGKLAELDPAGADAYAGAERALAGDLAARREIWEAAARPLRGMRFVGYHASWASLAAWLGMVEVDDIEPSPGVPPTGARIAETAERLRGTIALVLYEPFTPKRDVERFAALSGTMPVLLPTEVGSTADAGDYLALLDAIIRRLSAAVRAP